MREHQKNMNFYFIYIIITHADFLHIGTAYIQY